MIRARIRSFRFALEGIMRLVKTEINFQIQICFAILVAIMGFYFQIELIEWIAVIFAVATVLSFEAINTAIESICDYNSPEHNDFVKNAKDMAAGAVLIASTGALLAGILIFGPKIYQLLF